MSVEKEYILRTLSFLWTITNNMAGNSETSLTNLPREALRTIICKLHATDLLLLEQLYLCHRPP